MKVEQLSLADYNKIKNIPIVNQDLSASGFTPVANTYYRHTGTTGTYTQGVIYYYDGTEYKALDGAGGGGVSDVQVNGTSVVTDGVANIPSASENKSGVVAPGYQIISGPKAIKPVSTSSGSHILLLLKPNQPTSGVAYTGIQFEAVSSSGNTYPVEVGMSSNNIFIIKNKASYSTTSFKFINYSGSAFVVNTKSSASGNGGKVNCGATDTTFYLQSYGAFNAVPTSDGTLMSTPKAWNSGTSGTVKLIGSGTYQIYMNDGNKNINFGVVYWDGSTATCGQIAMVSSSTGYYLEISGSGVMTVYNEDFNGPTSTATTNTIYYRVIGA